MGNQARFGMAVLGALALAFVASGCDSSGGGPYAGGWYDVYGNYCGGFPSPGCDYYWNGGKISIYEDPYYTGGDTSGWWESPDGIIYQDGFAINSAQGASDDSRDLIGDVAAQEQQVVTQAGQAFAQRYALSDATGIHIAQTLHDWASLTGAGKRARTDQDIADFSRRLYGVSVEQASAALTAAKAGDASALVQLNAQVATYWGTTPETSQTILKNWYKNQLSDFGVR